MICIVFYLGFFDFVINGYMDIFWQFLVLVDQVVVVIGIQVSK